MLSSIHAAMNKIFNVLKSPGAAHSYEGVAPTQVVINSAPLEKDENPVAVDNPVSAGASRENLNEYAIKAKTRQLDRWLDTIVEFSGSQWTFYTIVIALLTWAFLGIKFGTNNDWQIVISNTQAIVNMVFDAFLMRQQFNEHDALMTTTAFLRSRIASNKRMLRNLVGSGNYKALKPAEFDELQQSEFAAQLPTENWLGKLSTGLSAFMGHIATATGFWVCIFIWLGFGKYCNWSNTWQLYINSATSALMVFILGFLANIRERHAKYERKCLRHISEVDAALEFRLRSVTGDTTENQSIIIPAPQRNIIQRAIDWYADLVGTLTGIAILILVIFVWVFIGPSMHFNSNWWLLIGTYAGLIGLNDGFVLLNVHAVFCGYEDEELTRVRYNDLDMLAEIGVTSLKEERVADNSLSGRVSIIMGGVCSHRLTVVLGVVSIIGLIIGASAMKWTVTGQLLCNVPPSIIESFFTMILITGHNIGYAKRRVDLHNIYLRRLKLVSYINTLDKLEEMEVVAQEVEVMQEEMRIVGQVVEMMVESKEVEKLEV